MIGHGRVKKEHHIVDQKYKNKGENKKNAGATANSLLRATPPVIDAVRSKARLVTVLCCVCVCVSSN